MTLVSTEFLISGYTPDATKPLQTHYKRRYKHQMLMLTAASAISAINLARQAIKSNPVLAIYLGLGNYRFSVNVVGRDF
jgi:hypothetical protein